MESKRSVRAVAAGIVAAMALSVAACGGTPAAQPAAHPAAGTGGSAKGTASKATAPAGAAAGSSTGTLPTLHVVYTSATGDDLPLWVGVDKGIFRAHGVNVAVELVHAGSVALPALLSGEVQVFDGSAGAVLAAMAKHAKLKWIGVALDAIPYRLWVPPSITKPAQLAGKKLAIDRVGGAGYIFVTQMLTALGLKGKVTLLQVGGTAARVAAFHAGEVQADADPPWEMLKLPANSYHALGDPAKLGIIGTANPLVVTAGYLAAHRAALRGFMQGYAAALSYVYQHPSVDRQELVTHMKTNNAKFLQAVLNVNLHSAPSDGGLPFDPTVTTKFFDQQVRLVGQGNKTVAAAKLNAAGAVDDSLVQGIKQSSLWGQLWPKGVPQNG